MSKTKVLIFIDWFLYGYKAGGLITSVVSILELNKRKYNFFVITSNKDLGASLPYKGIELGKWITTSNANVYYA